MSRFIIFITVFLLLCGSALCASVTREGEDIGYTGTEYTVQLHIHDAVPGTRLVVAERLPPSVTLLSSSITGAREPVDGVTPILNGEDTVWEFTVAVQDPVITYTVQLPPAGSSARMDGVYGAAPADFGRLRTRIALAPLTPGIEGGVAPVVQRPASSGFPLGALVLVLSGVALAGVCAWVLGEIDLDAVREGGWLGGLHVLVLASSARLKLLVADDQDEVRDDARAGIRGVHFDGD